MSSSRPIVIAALALGVALLSGCAGMSRSMDPRTPAVREAPVSVTVVNDNFYDMRVYAGPNNGMLTRIGVVDGHSRRSFVLAPGISLAQSIHLVAVPIGGYGRADSGPLAVSAGQHIRFNVAGYLHLSHVSSVR